LLGCVVGVDADAPKTDSAAARPRTAVRLDADSLQVLDAISTPNAIIATMIIPNFDHQFATTPKETWHK